MDKTEIALRLTLALIEKDEYYGTAPNNDNIAENIAGLYNSIYDARNIPESEQG